MSTIEYTPASVSADAATSLLVSVVIPCLNEAETIAECVASALGVLAEHAMPGEVLVIDNGSHDGSGELARAAGAQVIVESRPGYGSACLAGFHAARGDYIVMADADLSYDFAEIPAFVRELDDGAQVVIGDRMDNIAPGAMPWLHRYVGNPVLSGMLNLFFKTGVRDAHCGMRALRREVLARLDLRATGMEFASEMVIRAGKEGLDVREFAIAYHPRGGTSKLARWSDGWRHVRFLLVHSPTHLFLWPAGTLIVLGTVIAVISGADIEVLGRTWQEHAMVGACLLMIVGVQVLSLGLVAHVYGMYFMGERDAWLERMRTRVRLEHGLLAGAAIALVGLVIGGVILVQWGQDGFGVLGATRLAVFAATLVVIGVQTIFTAFLLSILGLRRRV
jgi:hypothetical protein